MDGFGNAIVQRGYGQNGLGKRSAETGNFEEATVKRLRVGEPSYTLPEADGKDGDILENQGGGIVSWVPGPSAWDGTTKTFNVGARLQFQPDSSRTYINSATNDLQLHAAGGIVQAYAPQVSLNTSLVDMGPPDGNSHLRLHAQDGWALLEISTNVANGFCWSNNETQLVQWWTNFDGSTSIIAEHDPSTRLRTIKWNTVHEGDVETKDALNANVLNVSGVLTANVLNVGGPLTSNGGSILNGVTQTNGAVFVNASMTAASTFQSNGSVRMSSTKPIEFEETLGQGRFTVAQSGVKRLITRHVTLPSLATVDLGEWNVSDSLNRKLTIFQNFEVSGSSLLSNTTVLTGSRLTIGSDGLTQYRLPAARGAVNYVLTASGGQDATWEPIPTTVSQPIKGNWYHRDNAGLTYFPDLGQLNWSPLQSVVAASNSALVTGMVQAKSPDVAGQQTLRWTNTSTTTRDVLVNANLGVQSEEGKGTSTRAEFGLRVNGVIGTEGLIGAAIKTDDAYPAEISFAALINLAPSQYFEIVGRTRDVALLMKCDYYNVAVTTL